MTSSTGGIISVKSGIVDAYRTGKGSFTAFVVNTISKKMKKDGGRTTIVFTEIPYQVNKARVIERIAELVKREKA
ncbi:DNA gyrase subunit A [Acinetobacter baumannii]